MAKGPWVGTGSASLFRVKLTMVLGASRCQMGFTLRDVAFQGQTAQTAAAEIHTRLQTPLQGILTSADSLVDVDVTHLQEKTGSSVSFGTAVGALNAVAQERQPAFLACVASFKSGFRTRYGTGRMFIPIRYEPWVEGDTLSTAGRTSIEAFLDVLRTNYVGSGVQGEFRLVNAHETLPAARPSKSETPLPEVPAQWYDVESIRLETRLTALRSRRMGVGT